jgi:hypothetical protein
VPLAWAEAGAAPYNNTIGEDPGLRDPEGGDFRADLAPDHGCRVFGRRPSPPPVPVATRTPVPLARQRLDVGGTIDTDTVWDAAQVRVVEDVRLVAGATLTVAAGAEVVFTGFHGLTVIDGSLQAVGTPAAPIVWTSEEPHLWQPDTQTAGAWAGLGFVHVPARRDSSRLRWCVLEHAKALPGDVPASGLGGAVRVVGGSPLVISHCVLRRNLGERGGAVGVHYGAAPLLVNNLVHDNHALLRGAGLYASNSYPVLVHNTFTANLTAAPEIYLNTGCLDHAHAKSRHLGGIVWGNPTTNYLGQQVRAGKAYYTRYCNIEGWLGGEGCLTDDPLLDDFFAPRPGSPVIDAGEATVVEPWLPAVDLAGHLRLVGAAPDLGAFELPAGTSAPPPLPVALRLAAAPNPFNPQTVLAWEQQRAGPVQLAVHDARGRRLRVLVAGWVEAGPVQVAWDGRDDRGRRLAAGAYLARLETRAGTACSKLVLAN